MFGRMLQRRLRAAGMLPRRKAVQMPCHGACRSHLAAAYTPLQSADNFVHGRTLGKEMMICAQHAEASIRHDWSNVPIAVKQRALAHMVASHSGSGERRTLNAIRRLRHVHKVKLRAPNVLLMHQQAHCLEILLSSETLLFEAVRALHQASHLSMLLLQRMLQLAVLRGYLMAHLHVQYRLTCCPEGMLNTRIDDSRQERTKVPHRNLDSCLHGLMHANACCRTWSRRVYKNTLYLLQLTGHFVPEWRYPAFHCWR
jgi:hypothetical protein